MKTDLQVGDLVRLIKIQPSLLQDLPQSEKDELCKLVGKVFVVQEISEHGFYWIGEEAAFSVAREDIERAMPG